MSLFATRNKSEDNDSGNFRAAVARAFVDNYHGEKTPGTPESGRRLLINANQSSFDGDISKQLADLSAQKKKTVKFAVD